MIDAPPTTYVVVCRGPHCRERGSLTLRKRLVELLQDNRQARLLGYSCFGQCEFGPNVAVVTPEAAVWFGDLSAPEAAERVVGHATSAAELPTTPLELPETERREHLRNIHDLIDTYERDHRRRRWWWPF